MDTTPRSLFKHEVYDDKFWQDGIAGPCNIVKYNGEDVRPVAFVEDVQMRHALINEHNRIVRQFAASKESNMEIALTPQQDSDNTSKPPPILLTESDQGRLMLTLQGPDRKIFLDRHEFRRAYNALFPADGL